MNGIIDICVRPFELLGCRKNAIHLEEKATKEREKLSQIIDAADAFKDEFYEKRKMNYEANKNNNRDKEKVGLITFFEPYMIFCY